MTDNNNKSQNIGGSFGQNAAPVVCSFCQKGGASAGPLAQGGSAHICGSCAKLAVDVITPAQEQHLRDTVRHTVMSPRAINEKISEHVIGQDDAKKLISTAVHNHYKRLASLDAGADGVQIQKSNILLLGPTGTGKTEIARSIAQMLDVPFAQADATSLTQAGYVGDDVESVVTKLLQSADGNIDRAQRGIIYIDEIDKIASRKSDRGSLDVSGEGVQQALLKLIEGNACTVPANGTRKGPAQDMVVVDTSNILFICAGAFAGIDEVIKARQTQKVERGPSIGFGAAVGAPQEQDKRDIGAVMKDIQPDDLHAFGLIPEFVGRLPVITSTESLTSDTLVQILTAPKNALVKQYQSLFNMSGVSLTFRDEALTAIAAKAKELNTGARGLRGIMEKTLADTMYELPDLEDVAEVVITAEVVNDNQKPLYITQAQKAKAAAPRAPALG